MMIGLAHRKPANRKRGIYRMDFGTAYVLFGVQVYVPKSTAVVEAELTARIKGSGILDNMPAVPDHPFDGCRSCRYWQ